MPSSTTDHPTTRDRSGPSRYVVLLGSIAIIVLLIDVSTKVWAVEALSGREPLRLAGGALYLTLARNTGAAFSMGTNFTVVITAVMMCVVVGILLFARKLASKPWAWALGLVLGGACGNLVDRLFRHPAPFRGAVIDFFSVLDPYGGFFPIFNVADICIVSGGIFAALLALTGREPDGSRTGRAGGSADGASGTDAADEDAAPDEPLERADDHPAARADDHPAERVDGRPSKRDEA